MKGPKRYQIRSVEDCLGHCLAHAFKTDGFGDSHLRIAKGARLTREHLSALTSADVKQLAVIVAGEGDVAEAEAAQQVAQGLVSDCLILKPAPGGRINFYAKSPGLFLADKEQVDALNAIDEGLGLATLADETPVEAGTLVASLKVVPFFLPASSIKAASQLDLTTSLTVAPFQRKSVRFIQTVLPHLKPSLIEKTRTVVAQRLERIGATLEQHLVVPHDQRAVQKELSNAKEDIVLLMGASAVCDRGDVIPLAIEDSGGQIHHFGIPVDPGNLLVYATRGQQDIVVLPGCARSPDSNGTDFVLWRLAAGLPLTSQVLSGYGVGGLLKETKSRGLAREQ